MSRRLMCPETSPGSKGFKVLHKLILEKYLANRFNEGEERGLERGREEGRKEGREEGRNTGREQANDEWGAWYRRMLEARERGEEFDEPPPHAGGPHKKE